nr:hypothetical protein GCM10020093_093870 [Planobispora longispora]
MFNSVKNPTKNGTPYDTRPAPRLDTGTPALLLRLDDNVLHHGTLAAIRSLGRAGVEVHAVLEGPHAPASRSRHLARMHVLPGGPGALTAALTAIAARIGRRALLIPMDDAGAIFAAEHAAALRPSFLLPEQPPALPASWPTRPPWPGCARRSASPSPRPTWCGPATTRPARSPGWACR